MLEPPKSAWQGVGSTAERLFHWGRWPLCHLMLKHWGAVAPARGPHRRESSRENSHQTSGPPQSFILCPSLCAKAHPAGSGCGSDEPTGSDVKGCRKEAGGEAAASALGPDSSSPAVLPGRAFGALARPPTDRLCFDRFYVSIRASRLRPLSFLVCDP